MCSCSVSALDIKSMARQGHILSTANIQDLRDDDYPRSWVCVVERMRIGDCVVFNDRKKAQNFYGSSRRVGIWVARYQNNDVISFTRYK